MTIKAHPPVRPLEGVRVVDFSQYIAGPAAAIDLFVAQQLVLWADVLVGPGTKRMEPASLAYRLGP